MIPIDLEDLVLADAVGALDADEREALTTRLDALPYAERMQIAELYDAAVILAQAVIPIDPPAHVWARLVAAIIAPSSDLGARVPQSERDAKAKRP